VSITIVPLNIFTYIVFNLNISIGTNCIVEVYPLHCFFFYYTSITNYIDVYFIIIYCFIPNIQIGEFETAESALNEANVMDIKNEEVWAYLTVVNIKMRNANEAKVCYIRALEVIMILI